MTFLVTNELKHNKLLSFVLQLLMLVFILFLLFDLLLYHYQIGLTVAHATETILGNEEAFIEPILFDMLLERVHSSIFTALLLLVLLSSIYIRVHKSPRYLLIHSAFILAILTPIFLLLSYVYGMVFIMLWIGCLVAWHLFGLYFASIIFWKLFKS